MTKQSIFNHFLNQAIHHPDVIAVRAANRTISYAELDVLSTWLSTELLKRKNHQNKVIAIYGKRSATLIVTILACARAGLTFAVLDSAYPKERILKMTQVIMPAIIIGIDTSDEELSELFDEYNGQVPLLSVNDAYLSQVESQLTGANVASIVDIDINETAYLLFTSGTTGLPKCIKTSHRPLVHFVDWYAKTFDVKPGTKFSMLSGLGHDPILRDIFVPLSTGGEINIPESEGLANPIKLFQWVQSNHIAYIHATPQLLRLLCAGAKENDTLPHLRFVFSGGDALRISHVTELRNVAKYIKVVNFYGTTETPQAMAFYEVKTDDINDPIPIGNGIDDVKMHVLGENLQSVAVGEIGQIGIETEYLSDGYLNDEALTSGRFIVSTDAQHAGNTIIYLTGDNGMLRPDGSILLKGRIDDQVKIRGFRVELGEIVTALEGEEAIQSAAVLTQQAQNGENFLVAYLVKAHGVVTSHDLINEIKSSVTTKIPAYMIPNHYIWLDALPLLPNGKLDRNKLPKIEQKISIDLIEDEDIESISADDLLIRQWEAILNISTLDTQKSFVELGGDSLSFIQASLAIEKNIGWLPEDWEKIPLKTITKLPKKFGSKTNKVSMPIFIRAVSIVLVVIAHFEIFDIIGSTSALFIIAGWSFGKYQIPTILKKNQVKAIFNTALKIAIPTLFAILLKLIIGIKSNWWSLFLLGNNFKNNKEIWGEYWFVLVLIQCLLVLAIFFSFKAIRELAKDNEYEFLVTTTLISIAAALICSQFIDTYGLFHRVVYTKIWLMFLGMTIAYSTTLKEKVSISIITMTSFIGVWFAGEQFIWFDSQPFLNPWEKKELFMWFPLVTTLMLIYIPRIKLPQKMTAIVNSLAESSLIIYLSSFAIQKIVLAIYPNADKLTLLLLALLGGVILWKLWSLAVDRIIITGRKLLSKIKPIRLVNSTQ